MRSIVLFPRSDLRHGQAALPRPLDALAPSIVDRLRTHTPDIPPRQNLMGGIVLAM